MKTKTLISLLLITISMTGCKTLDSVGNTMSHVLNEATLTKSQRTLRGGVIQRMNGVLSEHQKLTLKIQEIEETEGKNVHWLDFDHFLDDILVKEHWLHKDLLTYCQSFRSKDGCHDSWTEEQEKIVKKYKAISPSIPDLKKRVGIVEQIKLEGVNKEHEEREERSVQREKRKILDKQRKIGEFVNKSRSERLSILKSVGFTSCYSPQKKNGKYIEDKSNKIMDRAASSCAKKLSIQERYILSETEEPENSSLTMATAIKHRSCIIEKISDDPYCTPF